MSAIVVGKNAEGTKIFAYVRKDETIAVPAKMFQGQSIPELGEYLELKISKEDRFLVSAKIGQEVHIDGLTARSGQLRVQKGSTYGFVEDIFIPPHLVIQEWIDDFVTVLAFQKYDEKKAKYAWQAIKCELENYSKYKERYLLEGVTKNFGLVSKVEQSGKSFRVYLNKDTKITVPMPLFEGQKLPEIGDYMELTMSLSSKVVLSTRESEPKVISDVKIESDILRVQQSKDFGFVGDIYVSEKLIPKEHAGKYVTVLCIKKLNKQKNTYGWQAIKYLKNAFEQKEHYLSEQMTEMAGVIESVDNVHRCFYVYVNKDRKICVPFEIYNGKAKPKPGSYVMLTLTSDGGSVLEAIPTDEISIQGVGITSGSLQKNPTKGFGFVDNVYVPKELIGSIEDYTEVEVLYINEFNRKENRYTLRALTCWEYD